MKNLYFILEISEHSTAEEIKCAYRKLALRYHPDRNENGKERFIEVKQAYEILGAPEKKCIYDKFGYIEGEKENDLEETLSKFNKDLTDLGEVRVKNFEQSLEEKMPQTVCSDCEGLGFFEVAKGFFIVEEQCKQCGGTGYVPIVFNKGNLGWAN